MTSTTASAVKAWLADVLTKKSPRTYEAYAAAVDRFFTYLAAAHLPTQLDELKPMHVRSFNANAKLTHNSLAHYDRCLRAVFGRIQREGIDDFGLPLNWQSPWSKVERITERV